MILIEYLLSLAAGYFAARYLPNEPAAPYIPLLLSYHVFLLCLIAHGGVKADHKIGLPLGLLLTFICHLAITGILVAIVTERQYIPLFPLVQYLLPSLVPFEVNWMFTRPRAGHLRARPERLPDGTDREYLEFLQYLNDGRRRFQKTGRSIKAEYAAWLKDRHKRHPLAS